MRNNSWVEITFLNLGFFEVFIGRYERPNKTAIWRSPRCIDLEIGRLWVQLSTRPSKAGA